MHVAVVGQRRQGARVYRLFRVSMEPRRYGVLDDPGAAVLLTWFYTNTEVDLLFPEDGS